MNHSYRLIWSDRLESWIPVAEITRSRSKRSSRTVLASAISLALASPFAAANPQNGQVVRGQASISTSGSTLTVNQQSSRAVLNWQDFSIANGETTRFVQPSSSAVALNRITSQNPSQIHGNLSANGHVFLVNPNGIYFGRTATIDVHGLVATTHDIENDAFMAGNYQFNIPGKANAEIVNQGTVSVRDSGLAAFVAPSVRNDGLIQARLGKVTLASGSGFSLDLYGDQLVELSVQAADVEDMIPVENSGSIEAQTVVLTANTARNVVDRVINVSGEIHAQTATAQDGKIILGSPAGAIEVSGTLNAPAGQVTVNADRFQVTQSGSVSAASGPADGGSVDIQADVLLQDGTISATSESGRGGDVTVRARFAGINNDIGVSGSRGGSININTEHNRLAGNLDASATTGDGGTVVLQTEGSLLQAEKSVIDVSSQSANGGSITSTTTDEGMQYLSGTFKADGNLGGSVTISGGSLTMAGTRVSATGTNGGGNILVGGDTRGVSDGISNARTLDVNESAHFDASAVENNDGGNIVFWSDERTIFRGSATAAGGLNAGDGGFIEVSSAGAWAYVGQTDVSAANGASGTLLLDPENLTVSNSVPARGYTLINLPDPTSSAGGEFGALCDDGCGSSSFTALSNGYIVVGNPHDSSMASEAGAVYLFKPDGTLVSTLYGTSASDRVGEGVHPLNNGNFVVTSPDWDNGSASDAGAATWVNGETGLNGAVSTSNSLYGTNSTTYGDASADRIGSGGVTALSNGNYVVASPYWGDAVSDDFSAGAATWGNGNSGITGAVSRANSIYGTTSDDGVSSGGITALSNGNYVVNSPYWQNSSFGSYYGAATWGRGSTGSTGGVTTANSLYGTDGGDRVGFGGVTALTNGNYVVASPRWLSLGNEVGAATWVNGGSAFSGAVALTNSLYGAADGDRVSSAGIAALSNGHYVVASPDWNSNAGAATWRNGNGTGMNTAVSAANSLYGAAGDQVGWGGVTPLSNGHYVVVSPYWDNGASVDAGAVTWRNGNGSGMNTAVSAANSLYGAAGERAGSSGVTALTNGNYVVASPRWQTNRGAVTWLNGSAGTSSMIGAGNSLVGTSAGDWFGGDDVIALDSGNYVVTMPGWNSDRGLVIWGNGVSGTTGTVSAANSLVGTLANQRLGEFVQAYTTGDNFLVWSEMSDASGRVFRVSYNTGRGAHAGSPAYAVDAGLDAFITPAAVTAILNAGTNLVLQANNDLTIANDIVVNNASGNGGSLTLEAGRSVLINADIITDNGDLYVTANDAGANTLYRSAGPGNIVIATGVSLNTGTGMRVLTIGSGPTPGQIIGLNETPGWIGGAQGDWSDPANWAGGFVPVGTNVTDLVIPANVSIRFDPDAGSTTLSTLSFGAGGMLEVAGSSLFINSLLTTPYLSLTGGLLGGTGSVTVSNGFVQDGGTLGSGLLLSVNQAMGDLVINNSQGLKLGNIVAQSGDVQITSTGGNITGTGYISGSTVDLAALALGSATAPLQTRADTLTFNASSGDVYIINNNPLLGFDPAPLDVSGSASGDAVIENYGATTVPLGTIFSAGGFASLTANSPLTIDGTLTAGGDIQLTAANSGDLVINGQVSSSGGIINLFAPGGLVMGNIPPGAIVYDLVTSSLIDQTVNQFLQGTLPGSDGLEAPAVISLPALQDLLSLPPELLSVMFLDTMVDSFLTHGNTSGLPLPDIDELGILGALQQLFELGYTPSDRSRFYSQLTMEQVVEGLRAAGLDELADFFERTALNGNTNEAELMELLDSAGMSNDQRVAYLGVYLRMRKLAMTRMLGPAIAILKKDPDFADVIDTGHSGGDIDLQMPGQIETDNGLVVLEGKINSQSKLLNLRINDRWAFVDQDGNYRLTMPVKRGESHIKFEVNDPSGQVKRSSIKVLSKADGQLPDKQGRRIALFIGVDKYDNGIPNLDTPLKDVNAVSAKLAESQDFEVKVLANPSKKELLDTLLQYSQSLGNDDSLMVYYAGHGYMLQETGRGYWLPSDAGLTGPESWVSNRDVARIFHRTPAKQIMLVSDSCYSGAFIRGQSIGGSDPGIWNLRAVMGFSSGGEQPVWDGGGDGYSIFASKLLSTLGQGEIKGRSLYTQVRDKVTEVAPQVPGYSALLMPGYDRGADYLLK